MFGLSVPWEPGLEDHSFWAPLHSIFCLGLVKNRRKGWSISSLLSPCFGEVSRVAASFKASSPRQCLLNGSSPEWTQISLLLLHVPSASGIVTVTAAKISSPSLWVLLSGPTFPGSPFTVPLLLVHPWWLMSIGRTLTETPPMAVLLKWNVPMSHLGSGQMQILIQQIWSGAPQLGSLTSSQMMRKLPVWGLHFEKEETITLPLLTVLV